MLSLLVFSPELLIVFGLGRIPFGSSSSSSLPSGPAAAGVGETSDTDVSTIVVRAVSAHPLLTSVPIGKSALQVYGLGVSLK